MKKPVSKKKTVEVKAPPAHEALIEQLTRLRVTHYKTPELEVTIHPSAFVTSDKPTREVGASRGEEVDLDELAFQTAMGRGKS